MKEILKELDWATLLSTIWTVILVPIGKELYDWFKSKKLDEYTKILYEEIVKAVKCVQNTIVDDVKDTDEWTPEKMDEVKEIAKNKAIQALTSIAYRTLKEANDDFEEYLDSLIGTAVYDIKNGLK